MAKSALKILVPDKKSVWRRGIFFLIELGIAFLIASNLSTISIVKDIVGYAGQIQLGLLGIVFTGYALFQALVGDKLLIYLLTLEENQKSKLEESNESFIYLSLLQIMIVVIDLLIYMIMAAIPEDWCLTNINEVNVCIAVVLIGYMLYFNIEAMWELKSFVFNIYQLFNAHAMARVMDIIEKEEDK